MGCVSMLFKETLALACYTTEEASARAHQLLTGKILIGYAQPLSEA